MKANNTWAKAIKLGTLALAAVLLTVACQSKKPKTEEPPGGIGAEGGSLPAIAERAMDTDPMGSDSGNIQGLFTVYFEFDKSSLTAESRKKLTQNAEWIKNHPNFTVQIEGHTDSRGSVEYNLALGERRAKSVKAHLESLGVESRRMTIISYGKEKPMDPSETEAAWAKNRRANFVPIQ